MFIIKSKCIKIKIKKGWFCTFRLQEGWINWKSRMLFKYLVLGRNKNSVVLIIYVPRNCILRQKGLDIFFNLKLIEESNFKILRDHIKMSNNLNVHISTCSIWSDPPWESVEIWTLSFFYIFMWFCKTFIWNSPMSF